MFDKISKIMKATGDEINRQYDVTGKTRGLRNGISSALAKAADKVKATEVANVEAPAEEKKECSCAECKCQK